MSKRLLQAGQAEVKEKQVASGSSCRNSKAVSSGSSSCSAQRRKPDWP